MTTTETLNYTYALYRLDLTSDANADHLAHMGNRDTLLLYIGDSPDVPWTAGLIVQCLRPRRVLIVGLEWTTVQRAVETLEGHRQGQRPEIEGLTTGLTADGEVDRDRR